MKHTLLILVVLLAAATPAAAQVTTEESRTQLLLRGGFARWISSDKLTDVYDSGWGLGFSLAVAVRPHLQIAGSFDAFRFNADGDGSALPDSVKSQIDGGHANVNYAALEARYTFGDDPTRNFYVAGGAGLLGVALTKATVNGIVVNLFDPPLESQNGPGVHASVGVRTGLIYVNISYMVGFLDETVTFIPVQIGFVIGL